MIKRTWKNIAPITTLILTIICMHIWSTKFVEERPLEIEYNADDVICRRYPGLNWHDNHKEKVVKEVINKDNDNETPK